MLKLTKRSALGRTAWHVGIAAMVAVSCRDTTAPSPDGGFIVEDIARFWGAVDAGGDAAAFESRYLARATPALRGFASSRQVSGSSLSQMIARYPRYFSAIRQNMLALNASAPVMSVVSANFARMRALYPKSTDPSVTFLVGRFSTGGTVNSEGIIIGTEFYASDAVTPLDELGSFQRANAKPLSTLPVIVAHEHTHVLQSQFGSLFSRSQKTLLDVALLEGSADFIGELVSGAHINQPAHEWAAPREAAVWAEFQQEMNGTDLSRWLFNQQNATPDRPGDLGYYVGYRIAKAFYDAAPDKSAAIRSIAEVSDARAFLTASGYAPR